MAPMTSRFGPEEKAALARVIDSGVLWRVGGTEVAALEREFAAYYGVEHAVASTSGTAALHLAVAAINPEPGDEIIVPPITDFGTVIAVLAAGAVPIFADVDPQTGCITADTVDAVVSERTRAVIVVHLFGGAAPVEPIVRRCRPRGIRVIEDCAQAYLTVTASGRWAGQVGDLGCFSLQQYKHITAGDGGLTITADAALAERMRLFADKGWPRAGDVRTHLFLGLNYRMTELVGAVARVQLTRLAGVVQQRRATAARLRDAFRDRPGVRTVEDLAHHSFWLFPLWIDPEVVGMDCREFARTVPGATGGYLNRPVHLVPALTERRTFGTSAWPLTSPPARREVFYRPGDCPVAERMVASTLVTLPVQ
jgi:perosamine synthetase